MFVVTIVRYSLIFLCVIRILASTFTAPVPVIFVLIYIVSHVEFLTVFIDQIVHIPLLLLLLLLLLLVRICRGSVNSSTNFYGMLI